MSTPGCLPARFATREKLPFWPPFILLPRNISTLSVTPMAAINSPERLQNTSATWRSIGNKRPRSGRSNRTTRDHRNKAVTKSEPEKSQKFFHLVFLRDNLQSLLAPFDLSSIRCRQAHRNKESAGAGPR